MWLINRTSSACRTADLQDLLALTDVLASLVEAHGVRGVRSLRTAVQQLCRATLEAMHARTVSKLTSE